MPVLSRTAFTNKGLPFNVTEVLTNNQFDEEKYKNYSPLFLPAGFAVSYALSFASVTGQSISFIKYDSTIQLTILQPRSFTFSFIIASRLSSRLDALWQSNPISMPD